VRVASFAHLATVIRARPAKAGPTRVVAVDGPAGSGKTVFAARLGELLGATVICLDDLTPSWTGPDKEAELLVEQVLAPLATGGDPRYRFFDWVQDRYTEWREVPRDPMLLVEGVGAGSRCLRPYLSFLVWVEAPSALRLARGLERDGEERRPEWERWRAREDALFGREGTRDAADLLVDGAPTLPHEPTTEYVALPRAVRG
jgi:uridine kinase